MLQAVVLETADLLYISATGKKLIVGRVYFLALTDAHFPVGRCPPSTICSPLRTKGNCPHRTSAAIDKSDFKFRPYESSRTRIGERPANTISDSNHKLC